MEKNITRTQIRLPEDLYEELKASAEKRGRSLNAEMIDRIKYSFHYDIDERPSSFDDSVVAAFASIMSEATQSAQRDRAAFLELQKEMAELRKKLK